MEKEIIELKSRKMTQKIDELNDIYNLLFEEQNSEECILPEFIKKQYLEMYNKIIEFWEYERYKELEDLIIKEIARVELKITKFINKTKGKPIDTIKKCIEEKIYKSANYQEAINIDYEIKKIKKINQIVKLYSIYISNDEIKELKKEIVKLKFELHYRKQVEELIYRNGSNTSYLKNYDNDEEKEIYTELLEAKLKSLWLIQNDRDGEGDGLFNLYPEEVLKDHTLIERLIIIDMKENPYNYINLAKAKIFNAHICNIGNNPFEKEIYITKYKLDRLGYNYSNIDYSTGFEFEGLKADKVNYSILESLLRNLITDENVSYIDCENLYKRFGFECNHILVNIGQQCVKMIIDEVKDSKKYKEIINESRRKKLISQEKQYCKILFEGVEYDFYDFKEDDNQKIFNELLSKRELKPVPQQIQKKRRLFRKEDEPQNTKRETLQDRKNKIKKEGCLTTNIDVILSIIYDEIKEYMDRLNEIKDKEAQEKYDEFDLSPYELEKDMYDEKIERSQYKIELLEKMKEKGEEISIEDARTFLLILGDTYNKLSCENFIYLNFRKIIPLEDITTQNGRKNFSKYTRRLNR